MLIGAQISQEGRRLKPCDQYCYDTSLNQWSSPY